MHYPELFSICSILPYQQKLRLLYSTNRDLLFEGTCADILTGSALDYDGDEIFENRFIVYSLYPRRDWLDLVIE